MQNADFERLREDLEQAILEGARSVGILGFTSAGVRLLTALRPSGLVSVVKAIYTASKADIARLDIAVPILPMHALANVQHDILVVASDTDKESLLREALPYAQGAPKVILSGYGHLKFRDALFTEEMTELLVPSLANGYPNTLTHLYQCLANSARLGLDGVVAEFGMFKGGTTVLLARLIKRLERNWQVIGFDTFGGFPPRRNMLDMYDHPDCVFTDLPAVKRYTSGHNVEIIAGDIVQTCSRLESENLVLTFIDTDNYSSAKAALAVVRERTIVGGAIVFDHFTGVDRFRYTLGERMAGQELLNDPRYFHLHDTGVFYRQR